MHGMIAQGQEAEVSEALALLLLLWPTGEAAACQGGRP